MALFVRGNKSSRAERSGVAGSFGSVVVPTPELLLLWSRERAETASYRTAEVHPSSAIECADTDKYGARCHGGSKAVPYSTAVPVKPYAK
eukprot:5320371-Prymnesium_polylepis.2